jgi:hypothetical protein
VVRQFQLELISLPDLKYRVALNNLTYHACMADEVKHENHELAMKHGEDDMLKSDYSRFFKKKKKKARNIVPLNHGHLHNLFDSVDSTRHEAATHLQNLFRGMRGRAEAVLMEVSW